MSIMNGTPNQNIKRDNIYTTSLNMLKTSIASVVSEYGKKEINSVLVMSSWSQRKLEEVFGSVNYPYISVRPSSFQRNYESYNYNLGHTGYISLKSNGQKTTKLRLMPVSTPFSVAFVSQDESDVLKFQEAWLFRFRGFRFVMKTSNLEIGIRVVMDDSVTFPEQQAEETGNLFRVDIGGFMDSYIGESEDAITISKIAFTTSIGSSIGYYENETVATKKEAVNP